MDICNTEKFKYNKEYLFLPVEFDTKKLPKTIVVEDVALGIKTSFHVSLMCVKNIEENTNIENLPEKIINLFCDFIENNEINFKGFTGEFRFAKRNEDGRKSLVGMCNVENLNNFFDKVNSEFKLNIQYQPTHVSLYTLNLDEAIGLNSQEDIENMTKDVSGELPEGFVKLFG